MLTFTVPEEMRAFVFSHPGEAYSAMFEAAAYAIKTLAKDPRHIGCDSPGFCAILHTWGRQLQYHPHLHVIIPAGGVNAGHSQWLPSGDDFFLPVKALSKIYRARFQEIIREREFDSSIPATVWNQGWNVHSQAVGSGERALKYLARYVFRVGISDERIRAVTDTHVTITWTKVGSRRPRSLRLTIFEFMRRFLQHVLPVGFMKIRYYGFMSPNSALSIADVRELVKEANDLIADVISAQLDEPKKLLCPHCAIPLKFIRTVSVPPAPSFRALAATGG
jgi:hypothetical protein